MSITVKAKIKITHRTGTSTTECTTALGLAHEGIHALVQEHGTVKARELILEKLDQYQPEYPGYEK